MALLLMMVMEMIHMKLWVLGEKRGYINKVITFKTRQVYNFNYFKPNDHLQDQHYNVCVRQEDDMCRFFFETVECEDDEDDICRFLNHHD